MIVDTAMAATSVDVNENDDVARLYGDLRRIASELDLAVLILHHERKHQAGQTRDRGQAMMGARQWAGQAETHLTIKQETPLETEELSNGTQELRRQFILQVAKTRTGESSGQERIVVTSRKDPLGRLEMLRVVSEGRVEAEPSKMEQSVQRLVEFLGARRGATATRAELAAALERIRTTAHSAEL